MKKIYSIIIAVIMLIGCCFAATACGSIDDEKLSVVCTIFPVYDWTREILGDKADEVNLTMLLDSGVDLHSYTPTADDMITISNCDMFIYVGGESDDWVTDVLAASSNEDMVVINLLEILGDDAKVEEIKEGMQHEHEHEEEEEEEHEEEHEHEEELDEHIWLSLRNAQVLTTYIAQQLSTIVPENEAAYTSNATAYVEKLDTLDGQYQAAVDGAAVTTLLFADRFPFRYLVDDYGLDYYAAFAGCSAETEASFETMAFLTEKVNELNLRVILVVETSDKSIANTVIRDSNDTTRTVLVLNSLQSVTSSDVASGASYLTIMQNNLQVLIQALS